MEERQTIIVTQRLILRPWLEEDAADLYAMAKDPRVGPAAGWLPHTSVENSREIIRSVLSVPETYAVVPKLTGRVAGSVSIMRKGSAPMSPTEAEIGYWIGVPFWGNGLIPEAVRALLARCFTRLGVTGVWCGYFDGNEKSRRVQEKCAFVYHHTEENRVFSDGIARTEHFTYLSRERWERTL